MSDPVNIESVKVTAKFLRKVEEPFKATGDPKGLAIGAMAYVVEGAATELLELRTALRDLLKYLDGHDWGTIPEGATADRARAAIGDQQRVDGTK